MRLSALHSRLLLWSLFLSRDGDLTAIWWEGEDLLRQRCAATAQEVLSIVETDLQGLCGFLPRALCNMVIHSAVFLLKVRESWRKLVAISCSLYTDALQTAPHSPPAIVERIAVLLAGPPEDVPQTSSRFQGRILISMLAQSLRPAPTITQADATSNDLIPLPEQPVLSHTLFDPFPLPFDSNFFDTSSFSDSGAINWDFSAEDEWLTLFQDVSSSEWTPFSCCSLITN